ncbi:MAG: hypothetical protein JXB32_15335 [Deltaproteobacteria bacterium]|nr:hypothetical protein [Deltaproteobacteria bacterium]
MKVAVALFGIPRGYQITIPPIRKFIASLELSCSVHVRYHLNRVARVDNPLSHEHYLLPETAFDWCAEFQGEIEPQPPVPPEFDWNLVLSRPDPNRDGYKSARNLLHQLHSLGRVTAMVEEVQPDAVLFLRADLLYHSFPEPPLLEILAARPRLCIVPEWQWWYGINDRFAFCGREIYSAWGRRGELVPRFLQRRRGGLHGERLLGDALRAAGARIRTTPIRATRIRDQDRQHEENFDPRATRGARPLQRLRHFLALHLPL